MALIAATGKPLPKFIPCFAWFLEGDRDQGLRQTEVVRDRQDGDGPPQTRVDAGPGSDVGRDLPAHGGAANEAIDKGRRSAASKPAEADAARQ